MLRVGPCAHLLIAGVASVALAVSSLAPAAAQAPPKARVGFLALAGPAEPRREVFRQSLGQRGWVVGDNLVIEWREAGGKAERLLGLAVELVRLKVDVIVTTGTSATNAAQKTTSSVPIVFVSADAIGQGFVASLARPGGNLTGLDVLSSELAVKRLELLRETFPKVARVAVIYESGSAMHRTFLKELEPAIRALAIQARHVDVRNRDDIDRADAVIARERVNALFPLSSPFFTTERQRLADLAARLRLPAIYEHREYVDAGGLMSYGPNFEEMFRQAAVYVDKILRGARPADLPVEQPTKFELVINEKTARALGVAIPASVLLRADEVIR
jgi:putative ABC transport system substrate-binding protein